VLIHSAHPPRVCRLDHPRFRRCPSGLGDRPARRWSGVHPHVVWRQHRDPQSLPRRQRCPHQRCGRTVPSTPRGRHPDARPPRAAEAPRTVAALEAADSTARHNRRSARAPTAMHWAPGGRHSTKDCPGRMPARLLRRKHRPSRRTRPRRSTDSSYLAACGAQVNTTSAGWPACGSAGAWPQDVDSRAKRLRTPLHPASPDAQRPR
jgi:hypothetical protein